MTTLSKSEIQQQLQAEQAEQRRREAEAAAPAKRVAQLKAELVAIEQQEKQQAVEDAIGVAKRVGAANAAMCEQLRNKLDEVAVLLTNIATNEAAQLDKNFDDFRRQIVFAIDRQRQIDAVPVPAVKVNMTYDQKRDLDASFDEQSYQNDVRLSGQIFNRAASTASALPAWAVLKQWQSAASNDIQRKVRAGITFSLLEVFFPNLPRDYNPHAEALQSLRDMVIPRRVPK